MILSVLLYGSKARDDADLNSDTDLLGVSRSGKISKSYDASGISFHTYPISWMQENAQDGSLFLLHIVTEAIPLFDPKNIFERLRHEFKYRESYLFQIEVGIRVAAATMSMPTDKFDPLSRSRYFWGVRTALMAYAAHQKRPIFSSKALEEFSGINGLAHHINGRLSATMADCIIFGEKVISKVGLIPFRVLNDDPLENLRVLVDLGGVASATAGSIMYG